MVRKSSKLKGFTLIELLIVVAIIGMLAAIAIPNLLSAIQRSRQKRTMADMRSLATAWEQYAIEFDGYNAPGWTALEALDHDVVIDHLVPTYIQSLPRQDAWNHDWNLFSDVGWDDAGNAYRYQIASGGKDGVLDEDTPEGSTVMFDCDIVFENGLFIVWPIQQSK